ncbi:hypothetical protein ARMGADRAFT_1035921 [Armillaria gallica]|uniref:Uncharacterized protein n=1 Tax=Armillaria gallica TaxID=47427 RepID=A0A2H3CS88_ARMGA|nr:hypothetical protein ARMGADRAFT_1035921 [Armillaria gallica]
MSNKQEVVKFDLNNQGVIIYTGSRRKRSPNYRSMSKGEQVVFFHAEAERDWWLEQWELKSAEFLWCIQGFEQYTVTWAQLALMNHGQPGYEAYAQEKVHMYSKLAERGQREFENLGYKGALDWEDSQTLHEFIIAQWAKYKENKRHERGLDVEQ